MICRWVGDVAEPTAVVNQGRAFRSRCGFTRFGILAGVRFLADCFSQYASDRARGTHGTLMRCPLRCRTRGDRSTSHVFRAGGGLCCHRAVPHRCLSFVRLGGEFCRPQRIRSVTCAARLPDEWEASPGGARMHVHCLNRICGVDLRYGSTADQGRTGREDSTSRSWHPARVVGTHA